MRRRSVAVANFDRDGGGVMFMKSDESHDNEEAPLVLVVEDYPDAREMCAEYLRFSGFRVDEARNGEEALAKAQESVPDVVLMDLALPLMDGWEATRRLKSDRRTAGTLVVALTGHALAGHAEGARRAGCDAFVTKPCLPDELVDVIRRLLEARSSTSDTARQPDVAAVPLTPPTTADSSRIAAQQGAAGSQLVGDPPSSLPGWNARSKV
jgi:two-component system, cell cycle response regulator DivK